MAKATVMNTFMVVVSSRETNENKQTHIEQYTQTQMGSSKNTKKMKGMRRERERERERDNKKEKTININLS